MIMYNDIDKLFSIYDSYIKKIVKSKDSREDKTTKVKEIMDKLYNLITDRL